MLLTEILDIEHPIIMAPMFLVSNEQMCIEAMNSGIAACIPALNWRTSEKMDKGIQEIKKGAKKGALGINLIVNKSNPLYLKQLDVCLNNEVDFIITSLGNPKVVIDKCKTKGIKVFCDVVDVKYAIKVQELGADAIIAVNKDAGGHSGQLSENDLLLSLKDQINIPIITAGGICDSETYQSAIQNGAAGVSVGSIFIASKESPVSEEYKNACVEYGSKDIVMSTKISGTPCTVINTPYVQKTGTKQNWLERFLSKNRKIKKWVKMLTYFKGMKSVEKAAFSNTYKTVWVAGKSIEKVNSILPVQEIVKNLIINTK